MKFIKFSDFFHKRSQSDSALSSRLQSVITPAPRAASTSNIEGLVLPIDSSNPFATELLAKGVLPQALSLAGLPVVPPHSGTVSIPSTSVSQSPSSHISAASHTVVVEVLTRRIQELERVGGYRLSQTIVERPRSSTSEIHLLNTNLLSQVSELRSRLEQTRDELQVVQSKNSRLQTLLDLPILIQVFKRVAFGESAEDALVDAVKDAIGQPESSWRRLLEPVVGHRSPDDYIAQVNCTLRARRETRDWMKKTRFWKVCAKEDGKHSDTITPSVSLLSDVGEGSSNSSSQVAVRQRQSVDPVREAGPDAALVSTDSTATCRADSVKQATDDEQLVSPTTSVEQPGAYTGQNKTITAGHTRVSSVSRSNLPPLASVSFRESHSIRTSPSKKESIFTASSSTSSVGRKSKLAVSHSGSRSLVLQDLPDNHTPVEATSASSSSLPPLASNSVSASISTKVSTSIPSAAPPETPPKRTSRDLSFDSWEHLSNFLSRSFSFSFGSPTLSNSTLNAPVPSKTEADVPAEAANQTEWTHSRTSADGPPPASARQVKFERPPSTSSSDSDSSTPTSSTDTTPTSSPVKKSRLPLPTAARNKGKTSSATARFIKRISKTIVSRPVLVDTTNANAIIPGPPTPLRTRSNLPTRARSASDSSEVTPTKKGENRGGPGARPRANSAATKARSENHLPGPLPAKTSANGVQRRGARAKIAKSSS